MASLEEQQLLQVEKMSLDQIRQVKEQVDSELSVLQDSVSNIRTATSRFESAAKAVHILSTNPPGKDGRPCVCLCLIECLPCADNLHLNISACTYFNPFSKDSSAMGYDARFYLPCLQRARFRAILLPVYVANHTAHPRGKKLSMSKLS
jgi:hypothetical protein